MSHPLAVREARQHPRIKLPPMYTLVRVKPKGEPRYRWTGYIYDIGAGGMRFELDAPVEPGTELEVRAMLPGARHTAINAAGTVVRIHDDDDLPGPVRMGMRFDQFAQEHDRRKLDEYLSTCLRRAA